MKTGARIASKGEIARLAGVRELLFRYTDSLYRAETMDDIYAAALDAICEGLGCERASILRCDDQGVMRFVASRGLSRRYIKSVEGHSPWKQGDRHAEIICVEDIGRSNESTAIKAAVQTEGICGLAFIPLMASGAVNGKFMAYYDVARLFNEQECELALTIARQLGFAIERSEGDSLAQQMAALVDSSDDPIVAKSLDGRITSWNEAASRLFGYTAEEVIGRPGAMLFPDDRLDEEPQILARIAAGERLESYETVRRCKNGQLVDISLTVSPIKDASGKVIGASKIAHDITHKRRYQEQLRLQLREMNHRVKNLFALAGSLVQISARGAKTPAELAEKMVERLDALSRAHSLTMRQPSECSASGSAPSGTGLHKLVRAILNAFDEADAKTGSRIMLRGNDSLIRDDYLTSLALLLYELATNAAKHGSLSALGGRVEIETRPLETGAMLCWKETGGPAIGHEAEPGFGSTLIRAAASQLGEIRHFWEPDGLRVEIDLIGCATPA